MKRFWRWLRCNFIRHAPDSKARRPVPSLLQRDRGVYYARCVRCDLLMRFVERAPGLWEWLS